MELSGLSGEEWEAIETLFREAEGRRGKFVFLDPTGNLLAWSENLEREAWTKDPFIELTPEAADPFGTKRATGVRNSGGAPQCLQQTLAVPAWFQYCLSMWVRSWERGEVTVFGRSGTASARTVTAGPTWQRIVFPVKLLCSDELLRFGLELPAGGNVEVFGLQVEAQRGASAYKRTLGRSGVYPEARFSEDVLAVRAEAPGCYCSTIRIVSRI